MMTVADLKEELSKYDDDARIVVAFDEHDYIRRVRALTPEIDTAFLCGEDMDCLTNDECVSEDDSEDGFAVKVLAFNF